MLLEDEFGMEIPDSDAELLTQADKLLTHADKLLTNC
jgi:acyl carrier protein